MQISKHYLHIYIRMSVCLCVCVCVYIERQIKSMMNEATIIIGGV